MFAAACLMLPLAGCEGILQVQNPAAIGVDQLADEALLDVQVAGAVKALTDRIAGQGGTEESMIFAGNFLADEIITGLNWENWARVNQRLVDYTDGPADPIWSDISKVVRLGERAVALIDSLAPTPDSDERKALAAVIAGYGYVMAGEQMCEGVFNEAFQVDDPDYMPTAIPPEQIFPLAEAHFRTAISVGTAAGEPDIVDLARVGLMRMYLNMNQLANVVTEFAGVTSGFEWWIEYSDASSEERNNLYNELHGSNHTIGIHPNFLQGIWDDVDIIDTQTDPRHQHASNWDDGHNGTSHLYKPYQGLRYDGYSGETLAPASPACPACTGTAEDPDGGSIILVQQDTDVLLADYLEAQHHYYEALARQGGNDAVVLVFVNARRAVGNQAPVASSGAALQADLREQRSKDLFMGGFRTGDLRRWIRDGVGDFFPTGAHPVPEWGSYGAWTCFPIPLEEYEGSPNLEKPANPLDRSPRIRWTRRPGRSGQVGAE
jgi:hypothetical protein